MEKNEIKTTKKKGYEVYEMKLSFGDGLDCDGCTHFGRPYADDSTCVCCGVLLKDMLDMLILGSVSDKNTERTK